MEGSGGMSGSYQNTELKVLVDVTGSGGEAFAKVR